MIKTTMVETLEEALALRFEISGDHLYECYENEKRHAPKDTTFYVDQESGDIFYIHTMDDTRRSDKGLQLFHKLTLGTSLTSHAFNRVCIYKNQEKGVAAIEVINTGWERSNENRKIMAEAKLIVTTEAEM